MILFALLAMMTACVVGLLLTYLDPKHKKFSYIILFGLPVMALSLYLWKGQPGLPSQSTAFETNSAKRMLRFLQAQDPRELEKLKAEVEKKIKEDKR